MMAVSWISSLVMLLGLGGALPWGMPPAPENPALAAVAPEQCLVYGTWAGTDKPSSASSNQTEQLLAEPEVQKAAAQLEQAITRGLRQAAAQAPPEVAPALNDLAQWWPKLLSHPGAFFVSDLELRAGAPDVRAALVIHLGEDAEAFAKVLVRHQERLLPNGVEKIARDGKTGYRIQLGPQAPPIFWGVHEGYLGIAIGEGVLEDLHARLKGEPPAWLTQAREQVPMPRRATFVYYNVAALKPILLAAVHEPKVPQVLEALGLDNVTALIATSGLDEQGFVSKCLVALDGEPQGIVGLLPAKPLTAGDLSPLPRDALVAAAARVDAAQVWDTVSEIVEKLDPRAFERFQREVQQSERVTGVELRAGLLEPLGDVWRIYLSPSQNGFLPTGVALVADVDDAPRLRESLQKLREVFLRASDSRNGPKIGRLEFAGQAIEYLQVSRPGFPLTPAWCVTDKQLVVGLFPQTIKNYLSAPEGGETLAAVPEVAVLVQKNGEVEKFLYVDTRTLFDFVYPLVPIYAQLAAGPLHAQGIELDVSAIPSAAAIRKHLFPTVLAVGRTPAGIAFTSRQPLPGSSVGAAAPIGVALALPAVQAARSAARRAQSMNNLKQIVLALHNYHDVYQHFPPQYSTDAEGKPLLSWRVHILPFLEQQALYRQFKLDEPWDSPNNKRLAETVLAVYTSPGSHAAPGRTNYLGVSGPQGVFNGEKPTVIMDITDGTSNTIAVVEASDTLAVPWSKPDDFVPDAVDPAAGLGGLWPGGFLAAMCDGSVRMFNMTVDKNTLKALFTKNGGEVFDFPE